MPGKDDGGHYVFPRDYRILFPFEEDPETEGMWWELDYHKKRWRTVSWRMYDPEYWESCDGTKPQIDYDTPNESGSQTSEEDETGIENAFSGLTVNDTEARIKDGARYESESPAAAGGATGSRTALSGLTVSTDRTRDKLSVLFDSLCVSNLLEDARKLLLKAANVTNLVNGNGLPNGKPLLLAVVEEGHEDVVEFLLNHEATLESQDWDGNTALLRALHFGRGILAERLVIAGANINVSNNDGENVCDIARASLEQQKESIRIEHAMIHPREPPLVQISFNKDWILKNIDARRKEICALQRIIASHEQRQIREQLISQMYGGEQAEAVERHGELDDQALLVRLLTRVMETPRDTEWRTVACLARGTVYPWIFAVSGYTNSVPDGILYRSSWKERVFDLADVIGHDLKGDYRDGKEREGSFFACHSEKQLLAYFVWNHTTKLCSRDRVSLHQSEAQRLSKLHAEIYFAQPGQRKAELCGDCYDFCERIVFHFGFRLTLKGVVQGETTYTKEFLPG
ncbi:hypothetical protein LTR82_017854 [Friedmanniomyces endolithicus]|uniref:Single-strand DNA deaminase toxin A-like C-terminal domain-containing protein n=1 Tax=Friedmanniomyces endolithicus TaxID=329885 RepID=A0AAN6F740_9PEZI|nr:hypothetical protein LTR82_017854 [Friedmanniomyces endolithicus]